MGGLTYPVVPWHTPILPPCFTCDDSKIYGVGDTICPPTVQLGKSY